MYRGLAMFDGNDPPTVDPDLATGA